MRIFPLSLALLFAMMLPSCKQEKKPITVDLVRETSIVQQPPQTFRMLLYKKDNQQNQQSPQNDSSYTKVSEDKFSAYAFPVDYSTHKYIGNGFYSNAGHSLIFPMVAKNNQQGVDFMHMTFTSNKDMFIAIEDGSPFGNLKMMIGKERNGHLWAIVAEHEMQRIIDCLDEALRTGSMADILRCAGLETEAPEGETGLAGFLRDLSEPDCEEGRLGKVSQIKPNVPSPSELESSLAELEARLLKQKQAVMLKVLEYTGGRQAQPGH